MAQKQAKEMHLTEHRYTFSHSFYERCLFNSDLSSHGRSKCELIKYLILLFVLVLCCPSFNISLKFGSPYLSKAQQPQEQSYPFLPVRAEYSCVQTMVYGCQCLGLLTCANNYVDACIERRGCTHTVREHALKADIGRKLK